MTSSNMEKQKLNTWSQKNTTHFIIGAVTSLCASHKKRKTWSSVLESMKEDVSFKNSCSAVWKQFR